jgi:hypothetical protein
LGFVAWSKRQVFENKELKRNTIAISLVFYNISELRANEIFGVEPFVMLKIVRVGREKFVRFSRLLNWGWRPRPTPMQAGILIPGGCGTGPDEGDPLGWRSGRQNQNKPNARKAFIINEIDREWTRQTHREYLLTLQPLGVAWRPDFRKDKQIEVAYAQH